MRTRSERFDRRPSSPVLRTEGGDRRLARVETVNAHALRSLASLAGFFRAVVSGGDLDS